MPPDPEAPTSAVPQRERFAIVGIGASAGGLEALTELLRTVGESPGVAFVIITHQDRHHETMLAEILAREISLPVEVVKDDTRIQPNSVYVGPPDAEVCLEEGVLRLRERPAGSWLPIDTFLRSLAQDQGSRAIAVILSGSASDGALGAKALKAEGGVAFAQDDTARFTSMPHSAVAAGAIDFVLSPREIAKELVRIGSADYVTRGEGARLPERQMSKLFALLRTKHDLDFTNYKSSTIERRIRRRMALHKIEHLDDYLRLLQEKPAEAQDLYGDMLIRVTGFFRDPEVFDFLARVTVPEIMQHRPEGGGIRVWVPGCATGEEVYSLAMLFLEHEDAAGCVMHIFGTDVSEMAVSRASSGVYPDAIANEVSPERLRRFFTRVEGGYRVAKSVRDCCIFARQDMTRDPPFSRLDLISCRNVMIYLGPVLQRKVMAMFHYALRPTGALLLGSSESIGDFGDLFTTVDRKNRIYRKRSTPNRMPVDFSASRRRGHDINPSAVEEPSVNVFDEADRVLLSRYAPAGVLINENMEILQFRGRTSLFLEPAPGTASFNLLKMAKPGLLGDLRGAIIAARKKEQPVRREGIRVGTDGDTITAAIEVIPFTSRGAERFHLIIFEEQQEEGKGKTKRGRKAEAERGELPRIKRELEATREYLQSIIEEQEAMNEELRSANEEIQSSNEELQSTNEELETAKEELQSTNEELITLNEELESRNEDLARVNDDLTNILVSVEIPIVIVDNALRVRRFNPAAQRALEMQPVHIGRPLGDIHTSLPLDNVRAIALEVLDKLEVREFRETDRNGRAFSVRMRPYKTADNKIDGVVLVAVDLDEFRAIIGERK